MSTEMIQNLHHRPAGHADDNHEEPARNNAEAVNDVAQWYQKAILSEPAICWVEGTFIGGLVLVGLLGVYSVDAFRGHSG